jgi:Uncharacterized conserved protein
MSYIHGFLLPVPETNREAYREMAELGATIFKSHGALAVVETWGEDVPDGKVTSFPMAVKLEENERVVFSWIVWPDKETAEIGMKKSMEDERMNAYGPDNMPFDGMRMMWGGFTTLVEA